MAFFYLFFMVKIVIFWIKNLKTAQKEKISTA